MTIKAASLLKLKNMVKFRFSKKETKFEIILYMISRLLSRCRIKWEIVSNFCGLFRMSELYPEENEYRLGYMAQT